MVRIPTGVRAHAERHFRAFKFCNPWDFALGVPEHVVEGLSGQDALRPPIERGVVDGQYAFSNLIGRFTEADRHLLQEKLRTPLPCAPLHDLLHVADLPR